MAELIETPLTVIHLLACMFLILVVLVQPGRSGGMGALGGASAQQVFGGRGAGNFLTKTTWITATVFFTTSVSLAFLSSSADDSLAARAEQAQVKKSAEGQAKSETPAKQSGKPE